MIHRSLLVILLGSSLYTLRAQSDHFFVTVSGGDLYKVHIQACSTTYVGPTGYGFGDIAMTPSGDLYGIVGGEIYRIDTTNASTTYIGQSTAPGIAMVALTDATLLVEYAEDLYAISTVDATTTYIGNIGYGALGDLTDYFGDLYMSAGGQLIRIDSEDNFATILSVTPIGTIDPNMPICEGLATAMIVDGQSSIVGFSYPDLFCFSAIDGAYVPICQPPLPDGVPGAAWAPSAPTLASGCGGISTSQDQIQPDHGIQLLLSSDNIEVIMPNDLKAQEVRLRDAMGRLVKTSVLSTSATIQLNGLTSGLYAVEIVSGNKQFVERFIFSAAP